MSRRSCIITEEYSGLNKSGGIGACAHGLYLMLINSGHAVDVLITDLSCNSNALNSAQGSLRDTNFFFLSEVAKKDLAVYPPIDEISKSYCVYRFLCKNTYDVVHFNEWLGSGFYCAMARRQGLFAPFLVTHLHGGSEWVRRDNAYSPELEDFEREAIERSQIENSDLVISPSDYLLSYYESQGVKLPRRKKLNWFLPQWAVLPKNGKSLETRCVAPQTISELIYFGRHERRKGFELFVGAVALLPMSLQPDLTFIGRFDRVGREFSGSHVFRKLAGYAGRIRNSSTS